MSDDVLKMKYVSEVMEMYKMQPTEFRLAIYRTALKNYSAEDVAQGLAAYMSEPARCAFLPRPGHIIEQIDLMRQHRRNNVHAITHKASQGATADRHKATKHISEMIKVIDQPAGSDREQWLKTIEKARRESIEQARRNSRNGHDQN